MIITKWRTVRFLTVDGEDKSADSKLEDWKIVDSLSYFLMIVQYQGAG